MEYVNALLDSVPQSSPEVRYEFLTAAEEIFINVADYAYQGQAGELVMSYHIDDDATMRITFADRGAAFNPLEVPPPDIDTPLEDRTEGGFGIFMVKSLMDVVEYTREDGWNKLTIGKCVTNAAATTEEVAL
jgi:anti-sigma regulatory factor (Ser/Thr protein kinase)